MKPQRPPSPPARAVLQPLQAARAQLAQGWPAQALALLQALPAGGAEAEVCSLRGDCHRALAQFEPASQAYAQALARQPGDARLRFLYGEMLYYLGRHAEVVSMLEGLDTGDDRPLAVALAITLGLSQQALGLLTQAELNLVRAYLLDPAQEEAAVQLAAFYESRGELTQALHFLRAAARQHPRSVRVSYNLGSTLSRAGETAASIAQLQRTLALAPDHAPAHLNLGIGYLRTLRLREGWPHYAWRTCAHVRPDASAPGRAAVARLPDDLRGRQVRVIGEQGIGDELFFMRYLPLLHARGATVSYRVFNARLQSLLPALANAQADGLGDWRPFDPAEPQDGLCLRVGDLPLALGAPADAEFVPPIRLRADAAQAQQFGAELQAALGARPRVGLTWRAGTAPGHRGAGLDTFLSKEVPLAALLEVLAALDVGVVVLQRHPQAAELDLIARRLGRPWVDASAVDTDLGATLALLSTLDTVVGVSNTNLHLLAGLGGAAEVLVPNPGEFRWPEGQPVSPWFPGWQVYHQPADGSWDEPLAQLAASLARYRGPGALPD